MYRRLFLATVLIGICALQSGAQTTPASNVYVFPLFVDGMSGGFSFRSTLRVNSTDNQTGLACTFSQRNTSASLTGLDGFLYPSQIFDAGFSPLSVALLYQHLNRPSEILKTGGQGPQKTGYAKLACPNTVAAQLQYSYFDPSNNKIGEATVIPAVQGKSFQFQLDRRDGTRLGFSLVNDANIAGQFSVIARDQFNQVISFNLSDEVQAFSQVSKFVDEELPQLPSNFYGTVEIIGVPNSQSYAVGLQFTGSVFSTVQPIVRATPLPF